MYVDLGIFFKSLQFFVILFINSILILYSFSSYILLQKRFLFFASGCFSVSFFSTNLIEFSFFILEGFLLLLLLDIILVIPETLFFHQYPLINLFQLYCKFCLLSFFCLFISLFPSVFSFQGIFTSSRSFFICPSFLIFHPDFVFIFGFLREITILSLTEYKLDRLVRWCWGIFDNLFIFLFSILAFYQT